MFSKIVINEADREFVQEYTISAEILKFLKIFFVPHTYDNGLCDWRG